MGETYIVSDRVYIGRRFEEKTLRLNGGTLQVLEAGAPIPAGANVVDVSGKRVVPGFIDVHTHGAVGVDVNGATAEDLEKISRFFAGNGTTSWLCSVLTDTVEQTQWCIDQFKAHKAGEQPTSELLGIHLEGPFLASEYKGAMPERLLRRGDPDLLRSYQERAEGGIRYLTVSPEVEGVLDLIPEAKKLGIVAAIGHSGADYETAMEAIEQGAAAATHTFNAMALLHQHRPAILGAVLEAGDAKLADTGVRAGSTLTQDTALRNLVAFTGRPVEELLPALTENPARLIGVFDRKGSIADGKDADLVVLDGENRVDMVFCRSTFSPKNKYFSKL